MEISHLRTFLAVAKRGNLTRAADDLHLSQPAVSRQLQHLEQSCGLSLFERHGRTSRLSEAGQVLLNHAEQVLQTLENCERALSNLRSGKHGRLILGAGVTTTAYTLPGLIQQYKHRMPEIELSIQTGTTQEILQLVLERQVDLGFVTSPIKHADCVVRPLYSDRIVLVSDASLPFAGISISLAELSDLPLILYTPSGFRDFVENALNQVRVQPKVAMELDNIEGIKRMVAADVGYAFVPRSAVLEELQRGKLAEVPVRGLPELLRQTSMIRLRYTAPSPATEAFLDVLASHWPGVLAK